MCRNYYNINGANVSHFVEVYSKMCKSIATMSEKLLTWDNAWESKKKKFNLVCSVSAICQGHNLHLVMGKAQITWYKGVQWQGIKDKNQLLLIIVHHMIKLWNIQQLLRRMK